MDFSQAQFENTAPAGAQCAACQRVLQQQYFSANGVMICQSCAAQLKAGPPGDGGFVRFLKAFFFGSGAGLVGAIGYGLIIHYARMELALITILIGWMVGRSVRYGSEHRGGMLYQVMGAVLTYVFCMMAYVPDVVEGMTNAPDAPPFALAVVLAPFIALMVPFTGEMGFLGILILGFGVWSGFTEPKKAVIVVEGPFAIGTAPPPAAAP